MHIFDHVGLDPIEMNAEMIDGKRYYLTPSGNQYPSITTVISNNSKKQASLCLLYTSPSPRDGLLSRMPSSA